MVEFAAEILSPSVVWWIGLADSSSWFQGLQERMRIAKNRSVMTIGLLLSMGAPVATVAQETIGESRTLWLRGETLQPELPSVRLTDVRVSPLNAGMRQQGSDATRDADTPKQTKSRMRANRGSWRFNGQSSIVHAVPSDWSGFESDFTWEGFFLSPSSNGYLPETGIADRLVTQFAFDRGDWTRLAIGLVADVEGRGRLSVSLEGFEGRTFGLGNHPISADRWHHFALVHTGTPSAAHIRWYLDYRLTGELFLGGQSNQNTLRPPGKAPFTFGARMRKGGGVNRGFEGLLDELRLTPRPLSVADFLRSDTTTLRDSTDLARDLEAERIQFWNQRHQWARHQSQRWAVPQSARPTIDGLWEGPRQAIDDAAFLRRLSLTLRGRVPSRQEVGAFLRDQRSDRRQRLIERMLSEPEWADSWVGYWQDALAENPSVVFPTLNNSGAFRQWIYDSFRQNKPFDRFATELLLLDDALAASDVGRGPSGFGLATGNDAPMAMRSLVALQAFAAVDLKCARCHDSPIDAFRQADLFLLAAYLNNASLKVPQSSLVAASQPGNSAVLTTSLNSGQLIAPDGLRSFWLPQVELTNDLHPVRDTPRGKLAALIASPRNPRFSDVIVNRVWQRYFGSGLIASVDRWQNVDPVSDGPPQAAARQRLLRSLSAGLIESGYDLKWLARRILSSAAWQSRRQQRRLMSAEQLVDSMFLVAGKQFQAETLGVQATDPGAEQLPKPRRAWQFAALPNERDRPALGMPVNQTIVDVMTTFGWNGARQQPRSMRDRNASALQPLMLFNGLMVQRIVRLSETSAFTELCLQVDDLESLVNELFLAVLGRMPEQFERARFVEYLQPVFDGRKTGQPPRPFQPLSTFQPDWRKHLEPEQTRLMLKAQQRVAAGEPPTARLTNAFRQRAEDVVWALFNSPEFVVIP